MHASDYGDNIPALGDFSTNRRVLLLAALALVVGGMGTAAAWLLLRLINGITNLAYFHRLAFVAAIPGQHHLGPAALAIPVVGALIVGLMARYGSEKIRGHGIPEALEAILLGRSRMEFKVAVLKPLSAAISIGTGGPFGAEGPIIMTGGAFGSLFAQRFHLSAAERKTLLVAGAAAGMSAVFATPVAAVLLAVELLLFEWKPRSFIPVAVAALTAAALRVPVLGPGPIFPMPAHTSLSAAELLAAAGIGITAGFASALLTTLVYASEDAFLRLERANVHWMWWPALGALVVGAGGMVDPRVLGVGYDTIHALLLGNLSGAAAARVLLLKALVWAVALGSGTSGGVLAPLLIMGGALGALVGGWIPFGDAGLWSLVGMTAMMGGTMRAPLTALIFGVELTHDYALFPALLAGAVCALAVTVLIMRRSILTEKLARRGHHITREYAIDTLELTRVHEVMDRRVPAVPASLPLVALSERIAQGDAELARHQGTLITDAQGNLAGIITRGDLVRALRTENPAGLTVLEAGSSDLIVAYPDESLRTALARMLERNVGRLPVVEPGAPGGAIGYLGRAAILSAHLRAHAEERLHRHPETDRLPDNPQRESHA